MSLRQYREQLGAPSTRRKPQRCCLASRGFAFAMIGNSKLIECRKICATRHWAQGAMAAGFAPRRRWPNLRRCAPGHRPTCLPWRIMRAAKKWTKTCGRPSLKTTATGTKGNTRCLPARAGAPRPARRQPGRLPAGQRARGCAGPVHGLTVVTDDCGIGDEPELGLGAQQRAAAANHCDQT